MKLMTLFFLLEVFEGVFDAVDVFGGGGVAEGEAEERGELADFVEVVVDAEVAGAGHDVFFAEGGAEEMRIHAFDVEGHGGVRLGADEVDSIFALEKIIEFGGIILEVFVVFFGAVVEPVESSAEGDDFGPGLEAGFEDGVSMVFVLSGEKVVVGEDVIDHAATDEGELELRDEITFDDHNTERGGVHLMCGETDGVGVGLLEEVVVVRHGLGGVDDDEAFVLVDFLDEIFEVGELLAVKIGGTVDDDEGALEIKRIFTGLITSNVTEAAGEREAAVVIALEYDTGDVEALGEGHGGEEGGVVLDVGGDDLLDVLRVDLVQEEVEAVGGIEGEGDEVIFGFELEELEDFGAGIGDELVGFFAPGVLDAFAAGVVVMIVISHGVDDGLGAEALTGGVEVGGFWVEVGEVVHILYYSIELSLSVG